MSAAEKMESARRHFEIVTDNPSAVFESPLPGNMQTWLENQSALNPDQHIEILRLNMQEIRALAEQLWDQTLEIPSPRKGSYGEEGFVRTG